ncbi:MAG: hypothetical protein DMF84_31255, partial [Acidobacteria bacterium]
MIVVHVAMALVAAVERHLLWAVVASPHHLLSDRQPAAVRWDASWRCAPAARALNPPRESPVTHVCTSFARRRACCASSQVLSRAVVVRLRMTVDSRNPKGSLAAFVAISDAMVDALQQAAHQIGARTPLILVGLPGTGKTALSELIHERSGLRGQLVSCMPGQLEPDQHRTAIFGEQGSVPDRLEQDRGLLEQARGGTLVLEDFELFRTSTQRLVLDAVGRAGCPPAHSRRQDAVPRLIIHLPDTPDVVVASGVLTEAVRL